MPVTSFKAGLVAFILASLTVCECKGSQEPSSFSREHADVENATTVAAAVTTAEPKNDTKAEVTTQASTLRNSTASKATSSGWDTVYKLLYETFSYPEAKELDALLPLPTSYLTLKQRGAERKNEGRKKDQRKHASRELTYRTVSGGGDDGSGDHSGEEHSDGVRRERGQEEDPGSSESSSQSDEDDPEGDDDDEAEVRPEVVDAKRTAAATSSTAAPPSKVHRRTERAVTTGSQLSPPRPWREHGKDFGLPVREDRWSKHVAAKRREAQLIRRSVHDQLRMKALQWRQKENHFHQRYKPASGPALVV